MEPTKKNANKILLLIACVCAVLAAFAVHPDFTLPLAVAFLAGGLLVG